MKYCPKCGNKLEPGDKFCEKCGFNLLQGEQSEEKATRVGRKPIKRDNKFTNNLTSATTSWFKKKNHKSLTIGAVVILAFLCLVAGLVHKNGGSLIAPKNISYTKTNGKRVWLYTEGGKGKNATIDYIDVTKNGKVIEYQIFDDNITLGKVSKMSNAQLIKLGKQQDKKYFDKSIDEVKAVRDDGDQIGLQTDLMQDRDLKNELDEGGTIYYSYKANGDNDVKDVHIISEDKYNELKSNVDNSDSDDKNVYRLQVGQDTVDTIFSKFETWDGGKWSNKHYDYDKFENRKYNALFKHTRSVKYLAPKWQKMKVKNTTDDSGNKITSQKISYNSIDEYNDAGTIDKNITRLSPSQKQKLEILLAEANSKMPESASGIEAKGGKVAQLANSAFDNSYYNAITKNFLKPHTIDSNMTLVDTTSQKVYNQRYIGYQSGYDDNYLLTKAQNNTQKAIFSKPAK